MARYRIVRIIDRNGNPKLQVEEKMETWCGDYWHRHDQMYFEEREAYEFVNDLRRKHQNATNPEVIKEFD